MTGFGYYTFVKLLEIADKTIVKIKKENISTVADPDKKPEKVKKSKSEKGDKKEKEDKSETEDEAS